MVLSQRRRVVVEVIAVGIAYYAAALLGLQMQLPGTNAPAVWPPSGIGLAMILLRGTGVWPGIAAGAFLAVLLPLPGTAAGVVAAATIAAGNTLELIAISTLVRRIAGPGNPFERARSAVWFVSTTIVVGAVNATVGVTILELAGVIQASLYRTAWLTWVVADVAGMIVLAPAIYAWGRPARRHLSLSRRVEACAMFGLTLFTGELVFGSLGTVLMALTRPFQPLLMWAAFRFGQRETSSLAVIVAAQALWHTWAAIKLPPASAAASAMGTLLLGSAAAPQDWLRAVQFFICTTVVLALIVAAAMAERDQSKRDLGESERRFRTIFEQAAVGVALVDGSTGRFLRVNQRYADIVGYSPDQMCGMTFREITDPEDADDDANARRLGAGEETRFTRECRCRAHDGSTVWVKLTVSPMTPHDPASHHIAIVEDITARKLAEYELHDINRTFEERVRQRTAMMEIANRDLEGQIHDRLNSELQLRASLEQKDTLLREAHHRIKNNLSVVSSVLFLGADGTPDVNHARVLEGAQHRVRSMALAHDELYRSSSVAEIDLRNYFGRLSAYLCQSYHVSGRHRVVYTHADQVFVDADTAVPCGLIFTELLTNIFKHAFGDNRSGTIEVELRPRPDDTCTLVVTDDGVGIAPGVAMKGSVFSAVAVDSQPSTLGLRLVQILTRQLGGTFTLTPSNPGTRAVVEFPLSRLAPT